MKRAFKNFQTQWSGQFGVAHELSRRGYSVTFTVGNAPAVDLLCQSPRGALFSVQVKSLSSRKAFILQKALLDRADDLFFILVVLPRSPIERPEYFVLTGSDLRQVVGEEVRVEKEKAKKGGRPLKPFSPGFKYSVLAKFNFRDAWDKLPQ